MCPLVPSYLAASPMNQRVTLFLEHHVPTKNGSGSISFDDNVFFRTIELLIYDYHYYNL